MEREPTTNDPAATDESIEAAPVLPRSEFICAGCGRPLYLVLHSDSCFAEALVYCPDCERDYQERRGKWAE